MCSIKKLHWKISHNSYKRPCHGVFHLSKVGTLLSRRTKTREIKKSKFQYASLLRFQKKISNLRFP